jgi:hypothetical protein
MEAVLSREAGGRLSHLVPHLVPMSRGMLTRFTPARPAR